MNTELNGIHRSSRTYNTTTPENQVTGMKLVQKKFLQGVREFELVEDVINVRIKSRLKEEKLTVVLSVVNPDPVVNGSMLEFFSRIKADDVLFQLFVDKPNQGEFNAFVDALRQRARGEFHAFTGIRDGAQGENLSANHQEPPEGFDEAPEIGSPKQRKTANVESVETSIQMLQQFLEVDEIASVIDALQALKSEPESPAAFDRLANVFAELGPRQGAVLTYAPYIGILLTDDPMG